MAVHQSPQRRHGIATLFVVVGLIVMLLFASLAVDVGKLQMVRTELRGAIDAAALAGGGGLKVSAAEARARAKAAAAANTVNGQPLTLLDSDIELGTWNATAETFTKLASNLESTANAVRVNGSLVTARNTGVRLSFVPIVSGVHTTDVKLSAVSAASGLTDDVCLVQDVSGSFTEEIENAKTGDKALLTSLNTTGSKAHFGCVVFSGTASTLWGMASVPQHYATMNWALGYLSVGGAYMPSSSSGTDPAAGIEKATEVLDASTSGNNNKSMVIVSDGEPQQDWDGAHPTYSSNALLTLAQSKADAAYAKGINVYVVFWDQSNSSSSANKLKTLIRGKGTFTHVTNAADLPNAIGMVFKGSSKLVK